MGLEPPVGISATSGEGMADLYQLLQPLADAGEQQLKHQWQHKEQQQQQPSPASKQQQQQPEQQQQQQQQERAAAAAHGFTYQHHQQQQQIKPPDVLSRQPQKEAGAATELPENAVATLAAEEAAVDKLVQAHLAAASGSAADAGDLDQDFESLGEAGEDSSSSYLRLDPAAAPDADNSEASASAADASAVSDQAADVALGPLRLAILGLPNAGKSTLMNTLLGYERSLTGPEPGLTRDPTYGWLQHKGLDLQLVDTAGWKRATAPHPTQAPTGATAGSGVAGRSSSAASVLVTSEATAAGGKVLAKQLADASLAQAKRALGACHVVVLLLDAPRLLTIQQAMSRLELQLAGLALSQGKALIIGLNKSDAVPGGAAASEALRGEVSDLLEEKFLAAGRLPVLTFSGQEGSGTEELLDEVVDAYVKWNRRVSSHKLRASLSKHSVRFFGTGGTARLLQRIKWASQLKARPPTFVLLLRGSEAVDEGGQRFLASVLRQSLRLQGVPLRLYLRYNKRPAADKAPATKQAAKQQHRRGQRSRKKQKQANGHGRRPRH